MADGGIEGGIDHALRVLVVEDETLISIVLEDMIVELGAMVVGPFGSLPAAAAAADRDDFDVALIDMNLHGEPADDVARRLARRGIPFALVSGSLDTDLHLGATAVLQKPFSFDDIAAGLQKLDRARASNGTLQV